MVQDTLCDIRQQTTTDLEITTLLIPGHNDAPYQVTELAAWMAAELGCDVPLHFSAFRPHPRLRQVPPTPASTLTMARHIALAAGLRYVYLGNLRDPVGESTWCAQCGALLIARDRYRLRRYRLATDGRCLVCQQVLTGQSQGSCLGRLEPC